eukprot:scaffold270272_cov23-Tisochrysis_lutea.AAC.3
MTRRTAAYTQSAANIAQGRRPRMMLSSEAAAPRVDKCKRRCRTHGVARRWGEVSSPATRLPFCAGADALAGRPMDGAATPFANATGEVVAIAPSPGASAYMTGSESASLCHHLPWRRRAEVEEKRYSQSCARIARGPRKRVARGDA